MAATPPSSEDELSSPLFPTINSTNSQTRKRPRAQPSNNNTIITTTTQSSPETTTPLENLRRLASLSQPQPPSSIASSVGSRLADRTNPRNVVARGVARRPAVGNARRNDAMPTTPHAIRAMEERRRVAMTPSRERRRASGRGVERGSPFEILQALSRAAAAVPVVQAQVEEEEEEDEGEEEDEEIRTPSIGISEESDEIPKPPRLSLSANEMRIDDDEDDTGILRPPEISQLDEREDFTFKSVEGPRRAELDASILTGRRGRLSEFSGLFDEGKVDLEDLTARRAASPSFVAGEQGLFDDLGIGDDTIDFGRVVAGRDTASPQAVLARDIDLADSTFRFDIPQDITEAVSAEEDENEDADDDNEDDDSNNVELAAGSAINNSAVNDDDSGPEDFGSPSASEAEEDNIIDEDANVGIFLDDEAQEDEVSDDGSPEADEEDIQSTVSRELENQAQTTEFAANLQLRPNVQQSPTIEDPTKQPLESEVEETEELLVPQPPAIPILRRPISKVTTGNTTRRTKRVPKPVVFSKHGQKVPSLPVGVVKSLADSFLPHAGKTSKKTKKDTVAALSQATDWFFEQVAADLDAYSNHAGRDIIEEADIITLMKRQRVLATGAKNVQGNRSAAPGSSRASLFSLAQRFLPRELMNELRMEPPPDERRKKRRRISEGGEFD